MNLDTLMIMTCGKNKAFIYLQRWRLLVKSNHVKTEPLVCVMLNPRSGNANILVFAQNGTRERIVSVSTMQRYINDDK